MDQYSYKHYVIEPRSYEKKGPHNPAGWVPNAWLIADQGCSVEFQPISWPKIVSTKEDKIALQMARQWIDAKG